MANTSHGQFVWYELLTQDPEAAIAFYGELAGWKTQPFGDQGYTMLVGSQGAIGGVMALPPDAIKAGAKPYWIGSVQAPDADATSKQVEKLGGKIVMAPQDVPKAGRYAVLADPQGASFCVFKPEGAMEKHDASKEGEMCWAELMTSDLNCAFDFYTTLFGWTALEDMDMGHKGSYRIFGSGDERMGGMMKTPEGAEMAPCWLHYISTGDIEAAIGRATKRGAKVLNGPMDVPGGGRIAQLVDPQGALFALHRGPKS